MTIHSQTLVNPGAELGNTTGWTQLGTTGMAAVTSGGGNVPHSGSYMFKAGSGSFQQWEQTVTLDSGLYTAIDGNDAAVRYSAWRVGAGGADLDRGALYISFYDGSAALISTESTDVTDPATWFKDEILMAVPPNTRSIKIGTVNYDGSAGSGGDVYWDDFELDISDDKTVDYPDPDWHPKALQLGVYAWGTFQSESTRDHNTVILTMSASETSSGLYDIKAHQLGLYAWARGRTERRDLRAWPFTQDDHDFWVLQLGDDGTLIFDKLTGQWAQWRSPGFSYWRGNDGVQWEGWNICCDSESGKLWIIDPEGRLDDETTPITSVISGRVQTRMRKNAQCHMAELAVSEQEPPTGIDASTLTITLRTSDDDGNTFVSHGSITGEDVGDDITVRWYGLGLMPAPGRVFEITDTGYARRIDGLNIEVGDEAVG